MSPDPITPPEGLVAGVWLLTLVVLVVVLVVR